MNTLLDRYGVLLSEVDGWFQGCLEHHPDLIACRNGCSECCRGLFDITLLDAMFLKRGFDGLSEQCKAEITSAATRRLKALTQLNPAFVEPWLLNGIPEDDWDVLMPEEDETPCLLLSGQGECLLYDYRPMTCRLNGIPLIDVGGEELFDEWCTLNFVETDPRTLTDVRFGFAELFSQELLLFRELLRCLTGRPRNEVDLFIPAAVVMDNNKIVQAIIELPQVV